MKKEKSKNVTIAILAIIIAILILIIIILSLNGSINLNNTNSEQQNNLENNNTSLKNDENLDYVYDATYSYDNEYTKFNRYSYNNENTTKKINTFGIEVEYTDGMQYLNNLKVPYININTNDAEKANKAVKALYLESAKTFDSCAKEANEISNSPSCSQILTYRTYTYNDILSVVVIDSIQGTSPWVLNYNIYNFDLTNGNLLNYNELLSKLNYNQNETLTKTKSLLKNKIDSLYGAIVGDMSTACRDIYNDNGDYNSVSCYEKANDLLESSINDNSILFFVNNEGNLNILAIAYYDGVQNGELNHYLIEVSK